MQNGVFQTGNPRWSAVFSLFMGVMALIAAEFIPVSLLTPIARDLAVSEGMAGQTVTAVGVLAVLTSLLLAPLTETPTGGASCWLFPPCLSRPTC